MKQYILCASLLMVNNFNFSSQPPLGKARRFSQESNLQLAHFSLQNTSDDELADTETEQPKIMNPKNLKLVQKIARKTQNNVQQKKNQDDCCSITMWVLLAGGMILLGNSLLPENLTMVERPNTADKFMIPADRVLARSERQVELPINCTDSLKPWKDCKAQRGCELWAKLKYILCRRPMTDQECRPFNTLNRTNRSVAVCNFTKEKVQQITDAPGSIHPSNTASNSRLFSWLYALPVIAWWMNY
jgi:hypothetical protein